MNIRSMSASALLLPLVFCALPALAQAPSKADVEAYIKQIEQTHTRLNGAGREFGQLIKGAIDGGDTEKLALYRAYRKMGQVLHVIQLDTKKFAVPDHDAAREVKLANERFLQYQLEVVLNKIPGLLEIIDDATLEGEAKQKKLLAQIMKDNDREVELGKQLREKIAALREAAE